MKAGILKQSTSSCWNSYTMEAENPKQFRNYFKVRVTNIVWYWYWATQIYFQWVIKRSQEQTGTYKANSFLAVSLPVGMVAFDGWQGEHSRNLRMRGRVGPADQAEADTKDCPGFSPDVSLCPPHRGESGLVFKPSLNAVSMPKPVQFSSVCPRVAGTACSRVHSARAWSLGPHLEPTQSVRGPRLLGPHDCYGERTPSTLSLKVSL